MARILFVTQTAHPLGGVEVWLEDLIPALASQHDVTLGLVRGRRFHQPDRYLAQRQIAVPFLEIDGRTGTTEGRVRAIERAIDRVNPDVVVPVNIADTLEAVRRNKARGRNVRMLYPLHAIGAEYLLDVLEYRGVIDVAVTMNRLAEKALLHIGGLDPQRVLYTTYGVARPHWPPDFESRGMPRFVHVGRLTQIQKRVLDLIPLCRSLQTRGVPFRLEIVGGGPEEGVLRAALASLPEVRFFGSLSREALYDEIYPGASAILLLSEWETGPIVAWEAMRHGATVVTTEYVGLKAEQKLCDGENALIVPIGDMEAFAGAIQRLVEEPVLLDTLRRAAHDCAEQSLRIEQSLAGWEAAFASCLTLPVASDVGAVRLPETRGRLDLFTGRFAEPLRRAIGLGMMHGDAGSEWPHSYHLGDPRSASVDRAILALEA